MSGEPWTPGPWKNLGDSGNGSVLIVGESRPAPDPEMATDGLIHTAVAEVPYNSTARFEANARLIAAAPEMAAFVEEVADVSDPHGFLGQRARALLARIRGEP